MFVLLLFVYRGYQLVIRKICHLSIIQSDHIQQLKCGIYLHMPLSFHKKIASLTLTHLEDLSIAL